MKKKIEIKDLVFLIESNKITENELIKKYQSWTPLDLKDFNNMKFIGQLVSDMLIETIFETKLNYWDPNYPIALNHYPNINSDIFMYQNSFFMIYTEFGGHIPEKRCRYLNNDLIGIGA